MKKYSKWSDKEVKALFDEVKTCRENNISLLKAFDKFAENSGRKQNSVRNYYYLELSELQQNPKRCQTLGIDIADHSVTAPKSFTKEESEKIVTDILRLTYKGYSVRKACLELSNSNVSEMVRLQNKYRNVISKDKQLVSRCLEKLKTEGITKCAEKRTVSDNKNIIQMTPRRERLSDSEITSLFMGLVRLVKKTAKEDAEKSIKVEIENADASLRKAIVSLSMAESENKALSEKLSFLDSQRESLKSELVLLRSEMSALIKENIELGGSEKMEKLNKFMKDVKKKADKSKAKKAD